MGIGPACFLIPAELFPTHIRGFAMGISVAFNWGANVLVALFFPIGLAHFSIGFIFSIFLVISVIGWFAFYFFVPETKGLTLEQIEDNIENNIAVRNIGVNQYA